MNLYSLTSCRVVEEKMPLLHELGVAPALVFHSMDLVSGGALHEKMRYALEFDATAIVHLPFRGIDLTGEVAPVRRSHVADLIRTGEAAIEAGARKILLHSFLPEDALDPVPIVFEAMAEVVSHLSPGASIVIENTFERHAEAFALLVKELGVAAALDIPRIRLTGSQPADWWSAVGPRVAGLHAYASSGEDRHEALTQRDQSWLLDARRRIATETFDVMLDVPRSDLRTTKEIIDATLGGIIATNATGRAG